MADNGPETQVPCKGAREEGTGLHAAKEDGNLNGEHNDDVSLPGVAPVNHDVGRACIVGSKLEGKNGGQVLCSLSVEAQLSAIRTDLRAVLEALRLMPNNVPTLQASAARAVPGRGNSAPYYPQAVESTSEEDPDQAVQHSGKVFAAVSRPVGDLQSIPGDVLNGTLDAGWMSRAGSPAVSEPPFESAGKWIGAEELAAAGGVGHVLGGNNGSDDMIDCDQRGRDLQVFMAAASNPFTRARQDNCIYSELDVLLPGNCNSGPAVEVLAGGQGTCKKLTDIGGINGCAEVQPDHLDITSPSHRKLPPS